MRRVVLVDFGRNHNPCLLRLPATDLDSPHQQGGRLQSESVAALDRIGWPPSVGITGRFASDSAPYGALLLRLSLGALFLAHAGLKLFVFTPGGTAQFFSSLGLPPTLAYLTIAAEVLSGVALILGLWTRVVALAATPILLGAIFTVHGAAGFFFDNAHGGWEYPAFWIIALIVQALLGDGIYALRTSRVDGSIGGLRDAYSH